jgi:dipeptidyl aminopeptidase/acylaminoacyl peptidase
MKNKWRYLLFPSVVLFISIEAVGDDKGFLPKELLNAAFTIVRYHTGLNSDELVTHPWFDEIRLSGKKSKQILRLPDRTVHAVQTSDVSDSIYIYALTPTSLVRVSKKAPSQITEFTPPKTVGNISWLNGLTWDSKREQFVIAGFGGRGDVVAYDPTTDRWERRSELHDFDVVSLAYDRNTERLYAVTTDRPPGHLPFLGRLHPNGFPDRKIYIYSEQFEKRIRSDLSSGATQLAIVGKYALIFSVPPQTVIADDDKKFHVYIVDIAAHRLVADYLPPVSQEDNASDRN